MGSSRSPLIKSMFLRRVVLVGVASFAVLGVLFVQAWRLTVLRGDDFLQIAERRTVSEHWTPSVRGRILDRKGRVLAYDAPAFDVLADYDLITGDWAEAGAARQARREHRAEWPKLDRADRDALVATYRAEWNREEDLMWDALADALEVPRETLDERCRAIEEDVEHLAHSIWARREEARARDLSRQRELSTEVNASEGPDLRTPIAEQRSPHAIASGIDEATAFRVRRIVETYEGLSLDSSGSRAYPLETVVVDVDRSTLPPPLRNDPNIPSTIAVEGLATHILGWMRPVYREDMEERPRTNPETGEIDRGHYQTGDLVGSTGIEASQERILRGLRGSIILHRDTGVKEVTPPTPGRDVTVTIDAQLQARIQAAMDPQLGVARVEEWHRYGPDGGVLPLDGIGSPIHGAAVVLDIDTGDVLAMVTTPSFTRQEMATDPQAIWNDPVNTPWVNRAIGKPYAPGSPIKPLILCAACTAGVHSIDHHIECTGHFLPNDKSIMRCWIYKSTHNQTTHSMQFGGPLGAADALAVSCNIYFYTLGRALGPQHLPDWLMRFGVGRPFDLGVGPEFEGTPAMHGDGTPATIGESILCGIGQGPVAWTPMHAADVYATIARGGMRLAPHVLRDVPPKPDDLHLDPQAIDAVFEGLRRGIEDDTGTSNHIYYPMPSGETAKEDIITVPGISVVAKTGTATASPIMGVGPDGKQIVLRSGDHGWMVALIGAEGAAPRYAIAVLMEYGGSGGRVAGPVMNQVVWALRAEGYL